jgi:hypothetical protein
MTKFSRDFFDKKDVLFIGDFNKYGMFSEMVLQTFSKNNISVLAMDSKQGNPNIKSFKNFNDLPKIPSAAYTILDTDDNRNLLDDLKSRGIKKLLFHSKRIVDKDILDKCEKLGIETSICCPLMVYGTGFHKLHAFFAGVK